MAFERYPVSRRRRVPSFQFASGPTNDNVISAWIQHPVVPFARIVIMSRNLNKALIQGQVVSDGVLPSLLVVAIIWKILPKNQ